MFDKNIANFNILSVPKARHIRHDAIGLRQRFESPTNLSEMYWGPWPIMILYSLHSHGTAWKNNSDNCTGWVKRCSCHKDCLRVSIANNSTTQTTVLVAWNVAHATRNALVSIANNSTTQTTVQVERNVAHVTGTALECPLQTTQHFRQLFRLSGTLLMSHGLL